MPTPKISFITACHNCVELTKAMLESLEATVDLSAHEVILIDDASTDGTADYLDSLDNRFTILRNDTNRGFAAANNRAANAATGEILALLNNDLILAPGWLPPMLECIEAHPDAGAIGNIQLNAKTGWVDHAGVFFDLEGLPTHAWKTRKAPPAEAFTERSAVTAACMLIRKSVFQAQGGFDEAYRNGMEDVDLCVRLKAEGRRHFVANRSIVRHHISQSPNRHANNDANTQRFKRLRAPTASAWGQEEWPREYLARYARFWWRMEPRKAAKALFMLAKGQ